MQTNLVKSKALFQQSGLKIQTIKNSPKVFSTLVQSNKKGEDPKPTSI